MPLPTVSLDDRKFQDIVDQAKSLIPRYCPEWTDHNVSDPGVALIELFAWMTELLLYRVNQVPDKMYVKFLEFLGVRLEPPRPATAHVTFYLSAPLPSPITIPEGSEVATVRTETSPAIVFTTEGALTIRPPEIVAALSRHAAREGQEQWVVHDLRRLGLPGEHITMFSPSPAAGDSFYLGLKDDHSNHVLVLILGCEVAGGAGIDPRNPPLVWEVWQGGPVPDTRWIACDVEFDGTGGFNEPGEVVLHVPRMEQRLFNDQTAYWLRCRLIDPPPNESTYRVSPDVESLRAESRGGTVSARHAITFLNERLGESDGTSGQTFRLLNTPVLTRDKEREYLIVEAPGSEPEHWMEVADFAQSGPDDRHYTLDSLDGTIVLGPALLQPDGRVCRFGAIPPRRSVMRFSRYETGGGSVGNLSPGMLSVLKSSIPYVPRVTNRKEAVGGRDAQTLEDAKLQASRALRTRTRAVTADDHEHLTLQIGGVARAHCLSPAEQPGDPSAPRPGTVQLIVLPEVDQTDGPIPAEQLTLSAETRGAVFAHLNERKVLGTKLQVRGPGLLWVSVEAVLRVAADGEPLVEEAVRRRALAELYRYINPYTGGPHGDGWPFGRDLHVSELYAVLLRVPYVEFVEQVRVAVRDAGTAGTPRPVIARLPVPPDSVVCSDQHTVI